MKQPRDQNQSTSKIALNTPEACEYIGINEHLLNSFRRSGIIRAIKTGRFYIYPVSELDSFINRNIGKEITKDGKILGDYC